MADEFTASWQRWRTRRDEGLAGEYGWLSLIGLHWLGTDAVEVETVPGRWRVDGDTVYVSAAAADGLSYGGVPIDGELAIPTVDGQAAQQVHHGAVRVEPIRRGGWWGLRVRDPQAPTRTAFTGVPTFPPSPEWVVEGRFEPFARAEEVKVGSVVDGITFEELAVGVLRFTVDGVDCALTAFDGGDGSLDVLFRDATTGVTTYAASRALAVRAPDADGRVALDFNRAYNMPCAFTDFATCSVPPAENTLPVAVTAGEKTPA